MTTNQEVVRELALALLGLTGSALTAPCTQGLARTLVRELGLSLLGLWSEEAQAEKLVRPLVAGTLAVPLPPDLALWFTGRYRELVASPAFVPAHAEEGGGA